MEAGFQHTEQRAALVDAVEASLRPLMPLFLNYGVSHNDLTEMLARVFVTGIGEQLKKEGSRSAARADHSKYVRLGARLGHVARRSALLDSLRSTPRSRVRAR
jgi:hypothetical protein